MRLIDADALCEALLERWSIADTHKEKLIQAVMADVVTPIVVSQPTIEPEPKWIPCRERMPDKGTTVYATIVNVQYPDEIFVRTQFYYGNGGWNILPNLKVIAWMPYILPEPWKGEQE